MDLRQAAYVVAVVDHGTFTAAAASIPVSQPALSQAVASLERELGAPLFHRLGRSVVLTDAGRAFVEPARRMLRDAEVARAAVADVAGVSGGRLELVALATLAVEPVVELIGRFRRLHPDVVVQLREPESARAVADEVRSGASELGFGDLVPDDDLLAADRLGIQRLLAVLPPGTQIGASGTLRVSRLATFPLLATPKGTSTRRLLAAALRDAALDDLPTVGVETEHREALVPLVLAGAGATVLPEPLARAAEGQGAVVATLSPGIERSIVLLHRAGPLSPAAQAFRALALASRPMATA